MGKAKYTDWTNENSLEMLTTWAKSGLTEEQIAKNIGIARQTLGKWKHAYSVIGDALKKGYAVANQEVESALFRRATGYQTTETRMVTDSSGKKIECVIKDVPPDTTACIFWLKNRKPDEWSDRKHTIVEADFEDLTPLGELLKN